jgi:carbon-monoxide dehydrogenase large subunit
MRRTFEARWNEFAGAEGRRVKPTYIGRRLPRLEDRRFITGRGRYTDDDAATGALWAGFVRSPHAHARIVAIDADAARSAPGVRAVLTAAEYGADGHGPIAHVPNPADAIEWTRPGIVAAAGDPPVADVLQWPLARDRVRFVGEAVAVVVADSAAAARDALGLVDVRYDILPAVVAARDALAPQAIEVDDAVSGNRCFDVTFGERTATDAAFARATFVVERTFDNQRIVTAHMEPRAAIGSYDPASETYTVIAGNQGVMKYRASIAAALRVAPERVHVESPDVGGAFGSRTNLHPEPLLVAWAARRLGGSVRWTSDRSEAFLTDYQGRDIEETLALAFDADARIIGLRATLTANLGAYTVGYAPIQNAYRIVTGVYDVPAAWVRARGALTNTTPTAPFRGAGRPEATHAMERLLDIAAAQLGIDRIALRRRNLVQRTRLPYRTAAGLLLDAGDFAGNMERALVRSGWATFEDRRRASEDAGLLRGIGCANYVEAPVGAPRERLVVRVLPAGVVELTTGTQSSGQGHETTFAQIAADSLGVEPSGVHLRTGDSRELATGGGTHSNRSLRIVGTLLVQTCAELRERAQRARAELGLDAAADIFAVARALGEPLVAEADFAGRIAAHPTGCAVCELTVDPATGAVRIERYTQVDDCGQAINPLVLDGQTHGGIAMAIGQSLGERIVFDPETGGVSGTSFMDYAVPRAAGVPPYDVELVEDPTAGNPLRVKGGGEGGVTPGPAAIVNALCDALRATGVDDLPTPVTPERIWHALRDAPALAAR